MAGHSKWANIKHKKASSDAKRGKIWTRIIREITVAVKMGGADSNTNPRLRLAIDKAADANIPKENILRAIQRSMGHADTKDYEEIRYEGYGLGGLAILVDCLTDNKVRTVAQVRHAFTKYGGHLAADGAVSFLFQKYGQFYFAPFTDEEKLINIALSHDIQDIDGDPETGFEILCEPEHFLAIKQQFQENHLNPEIAEIVMHPQTTVLLTGENLINMQKMLEMLENLEDTQEVYSNLDVNIQN